MVDRVVSISAVMNLTGKGDAQVEARSAKIAQNYANAARSANDLTGKKRTAGPSEVEQTVSNRANRGTAGLRGAAGRDFSGLAIASGGTSGFVAAYATIAANIFAVTAAFKALSDAAKSVQLQKGLEQVGAQSGTTLKIVAKNMQEISGYALSTVESMRSVASATAAGFKQNDIERLTRVAKGASIALGRDMSDSMDRLFRGTIKLEPELLDELGLMTKLNDATKLYAQENNKVATGLTQLERRQAFLNAILIEGESKFGDIADSVPVSQFDKLTASIKDFSTGVLAAIAGGLNPFIDLLIKVPGVALLPLIGILGIAVNKLLPSLEDRLGSVSRSIEVFGKQTQRAQEKYGDFRARIEAEELASPVFAGGAMAQSLQAGIVASAKKGGMRGDFSAMFDEASLDTGRIKDNISATKLFLKDMEQSKKTSSSYDQAMVVAAKQYLDYLYKIFNIRKQEAAFSATAEGFSLGQARLQRELKSREQFQEDLFIAGSNPFGVLGAIGSQFGRDFKDIMEAGVEGFQKSKKRMIDEYGKTEKTVSKLGPTIVGVGNAAAASGRLIGSMMTALSAASGIIFAITAAISAISWVLSFFESDKDKKLKALKEELVDITKNMEKTNTETKKMIALGDRGKAFDAMVTALNEIATKYKQINNLELQSSKNLKDRQSLEIAFLDRVIKTQEYTSRFYGRGGITEIKRTRETTGKQLLVGMGITDEEEQKQIAASYELFAINLGSKFADNYLKAVDKATSAAERRNILIKFNKELEFTQTLFSGIASASKSASDALKNLQTPPFFKTDYTPVTLAFKEMQEGLITIEKLANLPELKGSGIESLSDDIYKAVLANKDLSSETDYLLSKGGQANFVISDLASEYGILQLQLKKTEVGSAQYLAVQDKINNVISRFKGAIGPGGIQGIFSLSKAEDYARKTLQTSINLVKLQEKSAGIVANIAKQELSMRQMQGKIATLQLLGRENQDPEYAAQIALQTAQEEHNLVMKQLGFRNQLIRLEFDLEKLKQTREMQAIRKEAGEIAKAGAAPTLAGRLAAAVGVGSVLNTPLWPTFPLPNLQTGSALDKMMSDANATAQSIGVTAEAFDELKAIKDLIKGMEDALKEAERIANLTIQNNNMELKVSATAVQLAQQNLRALSHSNTIKLETLQNEIKGAEQAKEAFNLRSEMNDILARGRQLILEQNAIGKGKISAQDQFEFDQKEAQIKIDLLNEEKGLLQKEHEAKMALLKFEMEMKLLERKQIEDNAIDRLLKAKPGAELDAAVVDFANAVAMTDRLRVVLQDGIDNQTANNAAILANKDATIALEKRIKDSALTPSQQAQATYQDMIANAVRGSTRGQDFLGSFMSGMGLDGGYLDKLNELKNNPLFDGASNDELKRMAANFQLLSKGGSLLSDVMEGAGSAFASAFQQWADGTLSAKEALRQFVIATLQMIAQLLAQLLVLIIFRTLAGMPPGDPSALSNAMAGAGDIPSLATFAAAGGIIPMATGGVMSRPTGGVVSRSTPVQGVVSSPTYLVGEGKYNEAVVPLPNGRDIPVQLHGSGEGTNNISININMTNGNSNTQMTGNDGANLGAAIAKAVQKELLAQKAPGGILNKYGVA